MRLDEDRKIRIEKGPQPSFEQFLARVDNVNNHGKLTPMELVGVMPEATRSLPSLSWLGKE